MTIDLPPQYDPKSVETRIYQWWESEGFFRASADSGKDPFCVVIPPPNITGILHMGHVLDNTPQDIVIRWKRMQGFEAAWIPGTDHAGIATQNVVEKELRKTKVRRQDLGRDKFLETCWNWREQYGNTIISQLKRLGCSCDWERTRFTMDEGLSKAVTEVFVRLHEKGLVYRGHYLVNWCPRCHTALSDEEVEHRDIEGGLWEIHYPGKDGAAGVRVATTRPETMLGDTAVAVHPGDERYKDLVGKTVVLPLVDREIPVVADPFVDPAFGTGAVKVTPAHDPNDFAIGQRHDLPSLCVMTAEGKMNHHAGPYDGLDRFACRKQVVADLEEKGLLTGHKKHAHAVGHCYRCQTVIEPYLSDQWFVRMKPLAEPAIEAARSGAVRFFPERWSKTYLDWLENIRDWCISRQLWWGHRIPVWYCDTCLPQTEEEREKARETNDNRGILVARTTPDKCPACGNADLRQDEDVLDTWFSSWLWPFSVHGWPQDTPELRKFYPTAWLNSGKDIIFFWVARMIMAGIEFTGAPPFSHVYIHGIARDSQGRKLSKSLNNSPDPLDLMEKYSADALRFGIISNIPLGADIFLAEDVYVTGRNFCNKLWNASRFAMLNLGEAPARQAPSAAPAAFEDRWILSRLHHTVVEATAKLSTYEFSEAATVLHRFFWSELCDWYVEIVKGRLAPEFPDAASRDEARDCLALSLDHVLRLLHPFVPHVTEEIWQKLRELEGPASVRARACITAPWPDADPARRDPAVDAQMDILMEMVRGVRNIRKEMDIPRKTDLPAVVSLPDEGTRAVFSQHESILVRLAGLSSLTCGVSLPRPPKSATEVLGDIQVFVPLEGLIDPAAEGLRQQRRLDKLDKQVRSAEGKLGNANFVDRAPAEIVEAEKARLADLQAQRDKILASLADLKSW